MADIDNLTEINENFDTVKTLLNSIRAQGILNTSDVDKLLSGINAKLEKINTDEDIDLIKVYLNELKQNFEERHNVLISKFGAIEALFANLLKNSSELPKSTELKELFDIVATNLSVFSREVVAQKESITDITMRLDAMRSDESQKKDIIKNITMLKPDLERLNNGFDTIVISLNDNFKTLAKTLSAIDQTEHLNQFADSLSGIEMSSNTILSALQVLDKKTSTVDESIKDLATKSDLENTGKSITELYNLNQSINSGISEINTHYSKIDNLADKIDASVNIIASLKSLLEENDNQNSKTILGRIDELSQKLVEIKDDKQFDEFKAVLTTALRDMAENYGLLDKNINSTSENINSILEILRALDINTNFSSVLSAISSEETEIKNHLDNKIQTFADLSESNLSRILNDISVNADSLNTKINQTQSEITSICEGSFNTVFENISDLKKIVAQLDENSVSSNNAMFANISDRLTLFETALKDSIELQENATNTASSNLNAQVENIKNLSNVLDYKMDSSVVEISNMTRMFETLKGSVDEVLALNFVETVKDLRADIYASKQDLAMAVENSVSTVSENMSNDLYGKYELIISKLDSVEDEFKKTQTTALSYIKETMEKISASIVDIISYVSESKEFPIDELDRKIDNITEILSGYNMNYIENVRDIVDIIRIQVENNLKSIEEDSTGRFQALNNELEKNSETINSNIKNSYEKLLEVQKSYGELKTLMNTNSADNNNRYDRLLSDVTKLNEEFDTKLLALKSVLLDKITEYKNEYTCDNADKINEFKFTVENLSNKNSQDIIDNIDNLCSQLNKIATENGLERTSALESLLGNLSDVKSILTAYNAENTETRAEALEKIYANFDGIKTLINSFTNENTNDRTAALEQISGNFGEIKTLIDSLANENTNNRAAALEQISGNFDEIKALINSLANENKNIRMTALEQINGKFDAVNNLINNISNGNTDARNEVLSQITDGFGEIKVLINNLENDSSDNRAASLEIISDYFDSVKNLINDISNCNTDARNEALSQIYGDFHEIKVLINNFASDSSDKRTAALETISDYFDSVKNLINNISNDNSNARNEALSQISDDFGEIKVLINNLASDSSGKRTAALEQLSSNFAEIKTLVNSLASDSADKRDSALEKISGNFDSIRILINNLSNENSASYQSGLEKLLDNFRLIQEQLDEISTSNSGSGLLTVSKLNENFENIKDMLEKLSDENSGSRTNALAKLLENFVGLKEYVQALNARTSEELTQKTNSLLECFDAVKTTLHKVDENVDGDMTRQLSIIESNFESLISQMTILNEKAEQSLVSMINDEYKNISIMIDRNVNDKLEEYKLKIEETFDALTEKAQSQSSYLQERISDINSVMKSIWESQSEQNIKHIDEITDKLKDILDKNFELTSVDYEALRERLDDFTQNLSSNNEVLIQNLKSQLDDMTKYVDSVIDIQTQESDAHIDEFIHLIEALSEKNKETENRLNEINDSIANNVDTAWSKLDNVMLTIDEKSNEFRNLISEITGVIGEKSDGTRSILSDLSAAVQENTESINKITAETSAVELQAIEESTERLIEQLELEKQSVDAIKSFISEIMQSKLKSISKDIEKETDAVISELVEQFDSIKKSQQDTVIQITAGIESTIENQIYNNIEDLKSYLDVKTDFSVLTEKLDNLKVDITSSLEDVVSDMNKTLDTTVFTSAISDFRVANEILVNSATDRINEKIASFIGDASAQLSDAIDGETKSIESKLALFDKKFTDAIVDKYEEIKLASNKYNETFNEIEDSVNGILSDFQSARGDIDSKIERLIESFKETSESTNAEIRQLNDCFENLRSQISNKSFDEAFQASINKQIASLESLIQEQYDCIADINEMCGMNLPDVSELNTLVKGAVLETLKSLSGKLDDIQEKDMEEIFEKALKDAKSDIITQFLNIFNQISFVAEQEEIIDYIQERHDELITVLSHIVTTTSDVSVVKNSVSVIDNKINSVRDEINQINEKITNIISSTGDVDYVYSLQDLESDIANLRVVLKEMQDDNSKYGTEFKNLMASTESVYKLVESIKEEMPDKKSFDNLTEDIVSISTRTNKLILASDESYKTLQDNLNDFKLVIDDLDERTRNFAQESGMDRIDSKLNALNTMIQNGAKTNQTFNQVFEYLAEWVDNAGHQISAISDKVETLDDIGQIKIMLADLKADAEDNSENVELIEALGDVFDKQSKKISAIETKLDKMIVENTINNQKNKIDLTPMEDTLNKFLAAIGDKMTSQQEQINSLESKLQKIVDIMDEKDTAQLTKKMGGMDRQIAKLNKSIEKIASHVVEK